MKLNSGLANVIVDLHVSSAAPETVSGKPKIWVDLIHQRKKKNLPIAGFIHKFNG